MFSMIQSWLLHRRQRKASAKQAEWPPAFRKSFFPKLESLEERLPPGSIIANQMPVGDGPAPVSFRDGMLGYSPYSFSDDTASDDASASNAEGPSLSASDETSGGSTSALLTESTTGENEEDLVQSVLGEDGPGQSRTIETTDVLPDDSKGNDSPEGELPDDQTSSNPTDNQAGGKEEDDLKWTDYEGTTDGPDVGSEDDSDVSAGEELQDVNVPKVTISAPSHIVRDPTFTIETSNTPVESNVTVELDIDFNGDGDFNDDSESAYHTLTMGGQSSDSFTWEEFPEGKFLVRARASNEFGSSVSESIQVNRAFLDLAPLEPHQVDPFCAKVMEVAETGGAAPEDSDGDHDHGDGGQLGVQERVQQRIVTTELESNDSIATANFIPTNPGEQTLVNASLSSGADIDFFSFTVTQRAGVFIDTDAASIGIPTTDTVITLFDPLGGLLNQDDDGYDFDTGFPHPDAVAGTGANMDSALYQDLLPGTYLVRITPFGVATFGAYQLKITVDTNYSTTVPVFESLPGAQATLFLDFDGHAATGDAVAVASGVPSYALPAFDLFGNGAGEWSPGERKAIETIWKTVAEDYYPFNINVTTSYNGAFTDRVGFRMVITNDNGVILGDPPTVLGFAFLDSFATSTLGVFDNVGVTYAPNNALSPALTTGSGQIMARSVIIGDTVSHEFGHALGLEHFTVPVTALNPIMNVTAQPTGRQIWWSGITTPPAPTLPALQNDIAIISGAVNGFGFRADETGNSIGAAMDLPMVDATTYSVNAIIHHHFLDTDFWKFLGPQTSSVVDIRADVIELVNDLDVVLNLYDSAGNLIASSAPNNSFDGNLTLTLGPETYFLEVRSNGIFGQMGQYGLAVSLRTLPTTGGLVPGPSDRFENNDSADVAADLGTLGGAADVPSLSINFKPTGVYDFDWFRTVAAISGTFTVTVNETSVNGDLELHLFKVRGAGLSRVASNVTPGIDSRSVSISVAAGEIIYIHVKGRNSSVGVLDTGGYDMFLSLTR